MNCSNYKLLRTLLVIFALVFPAAIAAQVINIDQSWLNANGPAPYYLDQANATYRLQTDVSTPGTGFALIANGITFDLNGHTITYNNAAPKVIQNYSFEQGTGAVADGWNFSQAPDASRFLGEYLSNEVSHGDYSLRFQTPCSDQQVSSLGTVTLDADTPYSLTAMFRRGSLDGVTLKVELVGLNGEPTRSLTYATGNNRGIQFKSLQFRTGSTPENYRVYIGIAGAAASVAGQAFIDEVKVNRVHTMGVAVTVNSLINTDLYDFTRAGSSNNSIVTNGSIIQGQDNGSVSIGLRGNGDGHTFRDLNITVAGDNSNALVWRSGQGSVIERNNITSNVTTLRSRDQFDAAVVEVQYGGITFRNNTIHNGPHGGLVLGTATHQALDNTIYMRSSRYTNGFAIVARGDGTQVLRNKIYCGHADYACRGIMAKGSTNPALPQIYRDNSVEVSYLPLSQEYGGVPLGGTYGVQMEGSDNIIFENNFVTAVGRDGVPSYALRMNDDNQNVIIRDNTFAAIKVDSYAGALKFSGTDGATVDFYNNLITSNDGVIQDTGQANLTLRNTEILLVPGGFQPRVLEAGYVASSYLPYVHTNINFQDTVFADQYSKDLFNQSFFVILHKYRSNPTPEPRCSLRTSWTTTIHAKNTSGQSIANATIEIRDFNDQIVASGTTDSGGNFQATLEQYQVTGDLREARTPHIVSATAGQVSGLSQFIADKVQTISLTLSNNPGEVPPASPPSISIADFEHSEGDNSYGTAYIPVRLSAPSANTITTTVSASDITATLNSDYKIPTSSITFAPGEIQKSFEVTILSDTLVEPDETFRLTLSNPTNATLGDAESIITILDNDGEAPPASSPSVSPSGSPSASPSRPPGSSASPSPSASRPPSSSPSASPSASRAPSSSPSPSASRPPNSPSSTPSASPSSAAGSKLDINNVSISEGNSGTKNLNFTVTLNPSSNSTVTVNYATSNLTATAGSDYVAKSGQLTFTPGQVSQIVSITINGDTSFESDETFRVTLSNPVNATIQTAIGTGTILNDDAPPASPSPSASVSVSPSASPSPSQGSSPSASASASIAPSSSPSASPSIPPRIINPAPSESPSTSASPTTSGLSVDDVEKPEGTERRGFTRFRFSITLTEPSDSFVFVTASTEDGTAQARRDYRPKSRTITFSPGQTKKRFVVKVKSDRRKEDDEQFFITLSNPVNSALVKHQGTGTIVDDD